VTIRFTHYVDLGTLQLDEQGGTWITAMRVGEYQHPIYGLIKLTPERIKRFADNVKLNVRGIDLDIDYDHKLDPTKGREAAGWVKDAKVEGDQLKLLVDWTQTALGKIKEKAYRYFSPEFKDSWTDAAGQKHQDVLFGGGITNRPFLKDLLPLNLSELTFADEPDQEEPMLTDVEKKLRAKLGLPEDATNEQVLEKMEKINVPNAPDNHGPDKPADSTGDRVDARNSAENPDLNKNPFDEKQLSEMTASGDPMKVMLAEMWRQREEDKKQLAELIKVNRSNAVTVKLHEYSQGDKILAPAVLEEAKKLMEALPEAIHPMVTTMLDKLRDGTAVVKLGESVVTRTRGGATQPDGEDPTKMADEKARKLMEGDKDLSYSDAMGQVFAEDLELFEQYRRASYID
jgi:hypothetical protein